ncbi:LptA/OstA family protein [Salinarimonas ramus]|uniref:Organic solvent tolerance protein OstA n=1 Tax=Salinarimonas ramus TaxID=690164 RepID=A0A917Q5M7_9HYPH|nr:LptA/OstA family protein [Salinarimonas ramus]GGK26717.1 organic solvent tolerance protein OstA [Salinarimonas ramus]
MHSARRPSRSYVLAAVLASAMGGALCLHGVPALAQSERTGAFAGLGSTSQAPIRIDADRLDVFEREGRAVYAGNVVAVQGNTTMRCASLTIFFARQGEDAGAAAQDQGEGGGTESIDRIECEGPVTILSEDQVATGARAIYDRRAGEVVLTGDVALSQGQNVTRGERLVYDVDAGVANIESGGNQRVRGLFVPGGAQ